MTSLNTHNKRVLNHILEIIEDKAGDTMEFCRVPAHVLERLGMFLEFLNKEKVQSYLVVNKSIYLYLGPPERCVVVTLGDRGDGKK